MQAVVGAVAQAASMSGGTGGTVTRGGLDLSAGASYTFSSIYDLIGSQVQVQMNGQIARPWTARGRTAPPTCSSICPR